MLYNAKHVTPHVAYTKNRCFGSINISDRSSDNIAYNLRKRNIAIIMWTNWLVKTIMKSLIINISKTAVSFYNIKTFINFSSTLVLYTLLQYALNCVFKNGWPEKLTILARSTIWIFKSILWSNGAISSKCKTIYQLLALKQTFWY